MSPNPKVYGMGFSRKVFISPRTSSKIHRTHYHIDGIAVLPCISKKQRGYLRETIFSQDCPTSGPLPFFVFWLETSNFFQVSPGDRLDSMEPVFSTPLLTCITTPGRVAACIATSVDRTITNGPNGFGYELFAAFDLIHRTADQIGYGFFVEF